MNIDFIGQVNQLPKDSRQLLKDLFQFTLHEENIVRDVEITISVVNNNEIQQLNKEFRNKHESTDVLSFPLFDKGELNSLAESIPVSLGDIVISIDRARQQANEFNHSLMREVCFLAIHGLLHLLGYDHLTKDDEKEMFEMQKRILKEFNLER